MKWQLRFLYVLPLFVLQMAASGCNRANPQAAGSQMPPPPLVSVAKAQAQDVPVYLDEIGKSYAFESVTVTPQVGGRITERQFQDGADLTKGQLLFVIDPRPYGPARFGKGRSGAGKSGAGNRPAQPGILRYSLAHRGACGRTTR